MGVAYDSVSLYYAFKPSESGLYAFRAYGEGMNPMITVSGEENPFGSGEDGFLATQQLTAGTTYIYELGSQLSAGATYSIVVTKVDAIEGEGTQEDPYVISGEGEYALTYPLDPSSTDANVVYMDTIYVTIDGSTVYNLTADDFGFTYPNIHYNDPSLGEMQLGLSSGFSSVSGVDEYWLEDAIIVTVEEQEPGTSEYNPIVMKVNSSVTVNDTSEWGAPYYYSFTAEQEGTYTVYATDPNVVITVIGVGYPASDVNGRGATNEFEAEAGETYVVEVNGWGSMVYDIYLIEGTRPDYDQPDSGSGTEADPYVISKALTYQAEVPAGGSVYYSINSDSRFTVTVEDAETAQVVYNGETYTPVDGVINFVTEADVTDLVFTTSDGTALAYNFTLTEYVVYDMVASAGGDLVGTLLQTGENTIAAGDYNTPNYFFVPAQSGDYEISVSAGSVGVVYSDPMWGENRRDLYSGESLVIHMTAGMIYPFYSSDSYNDSTMTLTPVNVAYDSYTGTGAASDSPITLGGVGSGIGAYEITIGSNTTLHFNYYASTELKVSADSTAVSATYNGTVYAADGALPFSFTSEAPMMVRESISFTVTNNTNASVTFVLTISQVYTLTAPSEGGDEPVDPSESDLVVGVNENVEIHASDFWDNSGTHYTFVATEAGTYTFDVVPATGVVTLAVYNTQWEYWEILVDQTTWAYMTSYTVSLEAGESFEIAIALDQQTDAGMPIDGTVTVTITQA